MNNLKLQLIQKPGTVALPIHATLKKDTANQILSAKEPTDVEKIIVHQDFLKPQIVAMITVESG